MPNKTIYVSDEDLALFQRAQDVAGGNLSATIVAALRRFLEVKEAHQQGFYEVTVPVGEVDPPRYKRFMGARIGRGRRTVEDDGGTDTFDVYRTPKERFVVHTRHVPNWSQRRRPDDDGMTRTDESSSSQQDASQHWSQWKDPTLYTVDVFESIDAMSEALPEELLRKIRTASEGPVVEVLDV